MQMFVRIDKERSGAFDEATLKKGLRLIYPGLTDAQAEGVFADIRAFQKRHGGTITSYSSMSSPQCMT